MNSVCHPLPAPVAKEMLQVLAQSLCSRPGEKAPARESRTRQMVHSVLGFEPRDGLEYMLSGLVFGHFHLILDSMRDVFRGEMDTIKARTKTTVVSLDRSMLGLVKELRVTRHRPISAAAMEAWEREQREAAARDADPEDWIAEWAGMPPAEEATPAGEPAAEPIATDETPATREANVAAVPNAAAKPAVGRPEAVRPVQAARQPVPGSDADDAMVEQHIAAFQEAMLATAEALAEARALDPTDPKTVSGD